MDGGRIRKERVVGFNNIRIMWTRPETRFTTIDLILNRYSARTLRAREHLGPVYMEVGTPDREGNPQVE